MKLFLKKLVLFLALPLGVCTWILFSEPSREYAWNSSPQDCDNRGTWLWNRLYVDTTPVDIAFLGFSHTINGIQDTLIQRLLSEDQTTHVLNMGYCRPGYEMYTVIARDLFATKKPRMIVVEINEKMGTASHPMYPYLATNADILSPPSWINQRVPANFYNAFLARLGVQRSEIFDTTWLDFTKTHAHQLSYGYRGYPGIADPASLRAPDAYTPEPLSAWRKIEIVYPREWFTRLAELCRENNVEIVFLYIPTFHDQPVPKEGMDFYPSLGKVLIPPDILRDQSLWRENDHLNDAGAGKFSAWVAGELAQLGF